MQETGDFTSVAKASERLFRFYETHCVTPNEDTLFSLLEAVHSLHDKFQKAAKQDFHGINEFLALNCLRNYFHHQEEMMHEVTIIPIRDYPIITDLGVMCIVPRKIIDGAINSTMKKHQGDTRKACEDVFHWYGAVVNINPSLFNLVVKIYQQLREVGVPFTGDAVTLFENSYDYEVKNGHSHFIDGRLSTHAGNIDELLSDIVSTHTARN